MMPEMAIRGNRISIVSNNGSKDNRFTMATWQQSQPESIGVSLEVMSPVCQGVNGIN